MDSFEFNKWIGAFLGTVFVVFSVSIIANSIFAASHPEREGFAIEAVEGTTEGGPEAPTEEPIAVLLATADVEAGQAVEKRCATCHTIDNGGANKVGPNLWDIVNRPIATHEGFSYSGAMKEFSQDGTVVWDYEHLNQFLLSPKGLVRGTAMAFAGLKNPQDRANLIAYMRTLSDNPAPLPEVPAESENAAAPEGEAAPADEAAPAADEAAPAGEAAPDAGEEAPAADTPAADAPSQDNPAEAAPAESEAAPAAEPEATPETEAAPEEAAPAQDEPASNESDAEVPAEIVPDPAQ